MKKPIQTVTLLDVCTVSETVAIADICNRPNIPILGITIYSLTVRELIALSEADIFTGYQGEAELLTLLLVRAAKVSEGIEI